jgi:glycosyltransferase involved in cell wall biosynthesis
MVDQGMQVEVICLRERPDEPRREVFNGVKILRVPLRRRRGGVLAYVVDYVSFLIVALVVLAARSCVRRFDVVHVHNMPDILVFSALVPKLFGARVILDLHDPMPELMTCIFDLPPESAGVRLLRKVEGWSIAFADVVLTPNRAFKRLFAARTRHGDKIHVVMNAPDEDIFALRSPTVRSRSANQPFIAMYHGSILERNGLDVAVEAVGAARSVVPGLELRIYGAPTPFLDRVLATARERGLDRVVRYFGGKRLEEVVTSIDECDLGVIPNPRNAFTDHNLPTRIFEYLCRGKAVIAPRTPGIQDYFGDGDLLFFEPGEAADLARGLVAAWEKPDVIAEVVARGQQVYITNRWTGERERFVGLLRGLLERPAPVTA